VLSLPAGLLFPACNGDCIIPAVLQVNPINKHVPANVFLIPSSGTKQMFNPEDSVRQRVCGASRICKQPWQDSFVQHRNAPDTCHIHPID
jgi:hypothetical protein